MKEHWINNNMAQGCILFVIGIALLKSAKDGTFEPLILIFSSMIIGMTIASFEPK